MTRLPPRDPARSALYASLHRIGVDLVDRCIDLLDAEDVLERAEALAGDPAGMAIADAARERLADLAMQVRDLEAQKAAVTERLGPAPTRVVASGDGVTVSITHPVFGFGFIGPRH